MTAKKKRAPLGPSLPGKRRYHRHAERAIAHNEKAPLEKRRSVNLTYKKINGRTVKRKVTPYAMRGNTLVGHDHKRGETRSYRMERVMHMEKSAFDIGFEKAALNRAQFRSLVKKYLDTPFGRGAVVGGITGGINSAAHADPNRNQTAIGEGLKGALIGAVGSGAAMHALHHITKHASFWDGFEKEAANTARLDRLMGSLKKNPKLLSTVHSKVRANDLQSQFRGLTPHAETSLTTAAERADRVRKAGGFKATMI